MKGRLFQGVVVREGAAVFKLFASGEDEALLVGRNFLLVLAFHPDIVNGIGGLNLKLLLSVAVGVSRLRSMTADKEGAYRSLTVQPSSSYSPTAPTRLALQDTHNVAVSMQSIGAVPGQHEWIQGRW